MSEQAGGDSRVKLRKSHRDRRRHSKHYHQVNIIEDSSFEAEHESSRFNNIESANGNHNDHDIDVNIHRSSLADKISDYEDVWSSPPREIVKNNDNRNENLFDNNIKKPFADISKSLGDLSDASLSRGNTFVPNESGLYRGEVNGSSMDSISFRNTNSPFYVEPADCLRENAEKNIRIRFKKSSSSRVLTRKVLNRYSDSNIQWKQRNNVYPMKKINSKENMRDSSLSNSTENILESNNNKNEELNIRLRRNMSGAGRSKSERPKPLLPPRTSSVKDSGIPPWRVDSDWSYKAGEEQPSPKDGSPSTDLRFPIFNELDMEASEHEIPGDKTVAEMIAEKLPHLPLIPSDAQSLAPSGVTKFSEYDNVFHRNDSFITDSRDSSRDSNVIKSPLNPRISLSLSDSGTEFSEPWDSQKWDTVLNNDEETCLEPVSLSGGHVRHRKSGYNVTSINYNLPDDDDLSINSSIQELGFINFPSHIKSHIRAKILSPQILAHRYKKESEAGSRIRQYSLELGRDPSSMFSQNISQFIKCTLESNEKVRCS